MIKISAWHESWELSQRFTISRGSKTSAEVVVVEIQEDDAIGRGECVPYARYGETLDRVLTQLQSAGAQLSDVAGHQRLNQLQLLLPAGAARNALDCALWDLRAKRTGSRAWELITSVPPPAVVCAYTLSLDDPDNMRVAAARHKGLPLLKIKVGSEGALEQVRAVRAGAPRSQLIVDANEAWNLDTLVRVLPAMRDLEVSLIEQPLPADQDQGLGEIERIIPIAADESCHRADDVSKLCGRYDVVNIKLDKTGGLTEALKLKRQAETVGLEVMVGCMVGTSLAMAPAMLLTPGARFVDLDGPLLMARDRVPGLDYRDGRVTPPSASLWG